MRPAIAAMIVALAVAAAPQAGAVGFLDELKRLGLDNEDYRLASAAAARLYESKKVDVGAKSDWKNPSTGAHGTAEIVGYDGRCAMIEHVFSSSKGAPHKARSRRCKGADGVWRLAPE